ncbi:MAG: hypothetical protein R3F34_02680 [Planctomycetota bacterium]
MPNSPLDEPPFWRAHWPWIVFPALLVVGLALWFALTDRSGGDFQY